MVIINAAHCVGASLLQTTNYQSGIVANGDTLFCASVEGWSAAEEVAVGDATDSGVKPLWMAAMPLYPRQAHNSLVRLRYKSTVSEAGNLTINLELLASYSKEIETLMSVPSLITTLVMVFPALLNCPISLWAVLPCSGRNKKNHLYDYEITSLIDIYFYE